MNKALKIIAVDLTPILPGGENGGAKIFVLELLLCLAEMQPQTQFILLTQAASHEELAHLDRSNMRRIMVVGPTVTNSIRPRLQSLAARLLPHLPGRVRGVVTRLAYRLSIALKRGGSSSLLRNMGVDLLFCPFTAPTYFESGIPTVCTIYDLQYKTYPDFFSATDVAHRDRTFMEACRKATALTAISDYSRNSAIEHGNLDPVRIRTIYLRMAQRVTPKAAHDTEILDNLKLARQQYLIYPANFWKHKNHEILLTAFGIACQNALPENVKLVCTGSPGERLEWLKSAAEAMGLKDRVVFPGYVSNTELATLLANARAMVFPSLYEGFGLPVIEAMAAGIPVACSNLTSLPEVAADAALMFDPRVPTQIAHAIDTLVTDASLREHLITKGLQRSKEFSDSERMAREYWDLFQYAVTSENIGNSLTGVYGDGWLGTNLNISVAAAEAERSLELELFAPEWLPQKNLKIQAVCNKSNQCAALEIVRGTNKNWRLPLSNAACNYEITINPACVPTMLGLGNDLRELTVILQRCIIKQVNGKNIQLFPEETLS